MYTHAAATKSRVHHEILGTPAEVRAERDKLLQEYPPSTYGTWEYQRQHLHDGRLLVRLVRAAIVA